MTFDDLVMSDNLRKKLACEKDAINKILISHPRYSKQAPSKSRLYAWARLGVNTLRKQATRKSSGVIRSQEERASRAWKYKAEYRDPTTWIWRSWKRLRRKCEASGMAFSIDPADISIPEFCPVLGIKLEIGGLGYAATLNSPSVDRFDNSKGYVKGNVRVISKRANSLKSDASLEEMEAVLRYMRGGIVLREE